MSHTIPMRRAPSALEPENERLMCEARAALEALLAKVTRPGGRFFGKIAIEVTVQNGVLGHVKEIVERTRK